MTLRRFLLLTSATMMVAFFSSCKERQAQSASDAHAGVAAVRLYIADADPQMCEDINIILDGVDGYIDGAADIPRQEQPKPTREPSAIVKDVKAYATDGRRAGQEAGRSWAEIGGIASIGAVAAVVLRTTGLGGPIGAILAGLLENATIRRKKEDDVSLREAATVMISTIESAPDDMTVAALKKSIHKNSDPKHIMAIETVKNDLSVVRRT